MNLLAVYRSEVSLSCIAAPLSANPHDIGTYTYRRLLDPRSLWPICGATSLIASLTGYLTLAFGQWNISEQQVEALRPRDIERDAESLR
ncbi:hypothetical protein PLICRDRAFT_34045 [Plicaturopsis crispa FD-325 SS-3]|nr:hypothetical protein PLICRDRAFT_34045 [Plicaturopsis crispa FD-325 SS-3]